MGRPRISASGKKVKIGISLDPDIYAWIVARTGPGKEFSSITHALERASRLMIEAYMSEEERQDLAIRRKAARDVIARIGEAAGAREDQKRATPARKTRSTTSRE